MEEDHRRQRRRQRAEREKGRGGNRGHGPVDDAGQALQGQGDRRAVTAGHERGDRQHAGRSHDRIEDGAALGDDRRDTVAKRASEDRELAQQLAAVPAERPQGLRPGEHDDSCKAQGETGDPPRRQPLPGHQEMGHHQYPQGHDGHENSGQAGRHALLPPAEEEKRKRIAQQRDGREEPPGPPADRRFLAHGDQNGGQHDRADRQPPRGDGDRRESVQGNPDEEKGAPPQHHERQQQGPLHRALAEARRAGRGAGRAHGRLVRRSLRTGSLRCAACSSRSFRRRRTSSSSSLSHSFTPVASRAP